MKLRETKERSPGSSQKIWFFMILQALVAGCSEGQFSAGTARASFPLQKIIIDGSESKSIPTPFTVKDGELEVFFEPGNRVTEADDKIKRPLTVYFAIDTTGSMQSIINAIKNNIKEFVSQIKSKGYEPNIGAVTFRDIISGSFSLSDDVARFTTFIGSLSANGGGDANEGSLVAVEEAVRRISSEDQRANSLKTILAITDNPGHRGGSLPANSSRNNCGINETVRALNALPKESQQDYRLYHSMAPANWIAPGEKSSQVRGCGGFQSGKDQFNEILSRLFPDLPRNARGAELGWPFTGETLLNEFVGKLDEIKPGRELVCLAKSAKLEVNDEVVSTWTGSTLSETYRIFTSQKPVRLSNIIKNEYVQVIQKDGGKLKVQRCCLLRGEADAGKLETCVSEKEQIVDFKVNIK